MDLVASGVQVTAVFRGGCPICIYLEHIAKLKILQVWKGGRDSLNRFDRSI